MKKLTIPSVDDSVFVAYHCEPIREFVLDFCGSSAVFAIGTVSVPGIVARATERDYLLLVANALPTLLTGDVATLLDFIRKDAEFRAHHGWGAMPDHYCPPRKKEPIGSLQGLAFCQGVLGLLFSYKCFCDDKGWQYLPSERRLKAVAISKLEKDKSRRASYGARWIFREVCRANDLRCCPYCNAEYVYSLEGKTSQDWMARSPLDHFFPKSLYPYFATALCNLIPCCSRCNSGSKLSDNPVAVALSPAGLASVDLKMTHPYLHDLSSSGHFQYSSVSVELMSGLSDDEVAELEFCPTVTGSDAERANASVDEFNLLDVYSKLYGREVKDIPQRLMLLRSGYYREMVKLLARRKRVSDDRTGLVARTVKRLLMGCELDANRINQERLSKVMIDLCRQLDPKGMIRQ